MKRHYSKTKSGTTASYVQVRPDSNRVQDYTRKFSRRCLLQSLIAATALAVHPTAVEQAAGITPAEPLKKPHAGKPPANSPNPPWYGFNLLEYFSTDPDWMNYFPYKNDGMFVEDDFRWIRDWGFNFVRLPMDYRFWTDPDDLMKIHEQKVEPIDRAIRLGEKYGIHVNICLHRAPGFCILDMQDPAIGVIPKYEVDHGIFSKVKITVEKTDLFTDPRALEAFAHQWTFFAQRYKGISSERLSFNLLNEPAPPLTHAERQAQIQSIGDPTGAEVAHEINLGEREACLRVAQVGINAVRSVDPQRLIVSDCFGGTFPVPQLIGTGVLQSLHAYMPTELTLYKAEWAPRIKSPRRPTWPLISPSGHFVYNRQRIEDILRPWREMERQEVRIHIGEMGCYKYTPHIQVLAWFKDMLSVIGKMQSGWALRNFRGPFGILDTQRAGTKFEDWHGHQLDRELLNLLQKNMPR